MSLPKQLLSGNEAIAMAALHAQTRLGTGYPGTPSTEILERFSELGGKAQWAPNEKVAMEVALGVAFAKQRTIVTMKHVGLNVAADAVFTAAYTGVPGGLLLIVADDPGMASSQNEQDSRRYAIAAGLPALEPSDSQEAYDFTRLGLALSEKWQIPVLLRVTTRVCHSNSIVVPSPADKERELVPYERKINERVMVPGNARPAHHRLRKKLSEIEAWNCAEGPMHIRKGGKALGIIATGISYQHACEAAPEATIMQPGLTVPLPLPALLSFAQSVERCIVIEEGDPVVAEALLAAGAKVEAKGYAFRFGELNVERVRRIISHNNDPEPIPPRGKPPELCQGCPHRFSFSILKERELIVSGDIGCYSLAVMPPFEAMDTCVCMGASIGTGLGLRHALPETEARKVVSVIGDSTFIHSGLTGIAEMVYNPPPTGHVVIILDNGITAMTGMQEHPGTGRKLDHTPALKIDFEAVIKGMGVPLSLIHI